MSLILSGTNGVSDVDGSAATPAIRGSDTNTGIFFPAADTIAFAEGGAEVARFDSSGNLGLGVTPSAWSASFRAMQVGSRSVLYQDSGSATLLANNIYNDGTNRYIASAASSIYLQGSGAHQWYTAPSGTAGNAISFTQAMTLTATGDTDLKLTTANTGSGATDGLLIRVNSTGTESYLWSYENGALVFGTNNAERARIDSSGNLLVGTASTSDTVVGAKMLSSGRVTSTMSSSISSESTLHVYSTGASAYRFYVNMAGTIFATSTTISAISDQRLKENVQDLDAGLDAVMALKPRKFDWKAGKGKNIKGDRGWIAQEFEQVFPDMIDTWKDEAPEGEEPYKSVRADLIPVLVKAIQEQQAIITALTARVAALEGTQA